MTKNKLLRMDNVGIVVESLVGEASPTENNAISFFSEIGLKLEGRGTVEGEWAGRVTGLGSQCVEIAMMVTPDGHSRLELSRFITPPTISDHRTEPVNALGYLRVMFTVEDIDEMVSRLTKHGAQLVGEVVQYENSYRLCYIRGTEGLLIGLAEEIGNKSVEVHITTSTGTLYGTQIISTSNAPEPVVLIVAGSGPTDRDGNNPLAGQNNSLKLLAEGLADRGIASIRYDKRGIGESSAAVPEEADLRFDTYVEDAALWIQQLQADSRFSSVTTIGHSEGSLIGMLATQKTGADAFVSIAGPARTASQVLREQLQPRLPDALWQQSEQILAALEQGNTVASVPPELNMLYRSSVQPYLISWFRYTPAQEIRCLTVPALIVQGTTDIQVPVSEAQALKMAKPDAEIRIIEGMNHVLKAVPLDPQQQNASYSEPTLPVVPELVEGISQFIHSRGMRRESNQSLRRNVPS